MVVLKKNLVSSTFVYIQWEPIDKDTLPQTFREYFVAVGKRIMDLSTEQYNYTTSNTSFNVTDLQPNTFYYIAVGYYVTDSEGIRMSSGLSDIINVTTLPLCKLWMLGCILHHVHGHTHNTMNTCIHRVHTHIQHTCACASHHLSAHTCPPILLTHGNTVTYVTEQSTTVIE